MSQYHVDLTLFFSMTSDYLNTFLIQSCARSKYTQNSYKQALNCFRKYVVNVRNTSAMKFKFRKRSKINCIPAIQMDGFFYVSKVKGMSKHIMNFSSVYTHRVHLFFQY